MPATTEKPVQAVVLETVSQAQTVVRRLRTAGFTDKEISVLCSDEKRLKPFRNFVEEKPAGSQTDSAITTAGTVGLGLGTAVIATSLVTTGGAALFAIGAFAGVALVGTFAAAMLTRGTERELADYYDQAITHGKLLVAVDTEDPRKQAEAHRIFQEFHLPAQPLDHEV
jgi:hypothetical protein